MRGIERKREREREKMIHVYKRTHTCIHTLNCVNPCIHKKNVANERKNFANASSSAFFDK